MHEALKLQKVETLAATLEALVERTPDAIRARVHAVAINAAPDVANAFYETFLKHPQGRAFLTHKLVQERLVHSMTHWVETLFQPMPTEALTGIIGRNFEVGMVHARVNVPVSLVNQGVRVVRGDLVSRIMEQNDLETDDLIAAIRFVTDLMDILADAMHEAYLGDLMGTVRHQQSLKMFMTSQNLALEAERLKSSLFNWLRNTIVALYDGPRGADDIPSIEHSDFGLWMNHKAELTFGPVPELAALRDRTQEVDQRIRKGLRGRSERVDGAFVKALNTDVTQLAYLLSILTEKAIEIESGRDSLTRLLTRRFMPAILQREVGISIRQNTPFAVLMLDCDHFKRINDTQGHNVGDQVLTGIAERLLANVRAGDFVFRYGGEEFMVVMTEMDSALVRIKAEALRAVVADSPFPIGGGKTLAVTLSIGVALHDGHPDYEHTVGQADNALLAAKRAGRNRVIFALP
ncbi:MAG: GGDEF domain-containing protein [Rhodospirillum sp.]|nr:GGDEF domain-containing protein [Rhodospirillum sp.]MCF8490372.1 GGDEF domain-containing protein [Rhodospirillum sp.]